MKKNQELNANFKIAILPLGQNAHKVVFINAFKGEKKIFVML
jgi:hypothetical protein